MPTQIPPFPTARVALTGIIRSRLSACLDPFATHSLSAPIQASRNGTKEHSNNISSRKSADSNTTALPFKTAVTALERFLNDVQTAECVPPSLCFLGPPAAGKTKAVSLALRSHISKIPESCNPIVNTETATQPLASAVIKERPLIVVYVPCNLFDPVAIDDAGLRFVVKHLRMYLRSKSLQSEEFNMRSPVAALRFLLDVVKRNMMVALIVLDNLEVLCKPVSTFAPQQTLLYTLLDLQHRSLPVCTLAISSTLHLFDFLEKRIRSRFSFRRLFLSNAIQFETLSKCIQSFLNVNLAELTTQGTLALIAPDEIPVLKDFLDCYSTWVQTFFTDVNLKHSWMESLLQGKDFSWFCSQAFELFLQHIILENTLVSFTTPAVTSSKNSKSMNPKCGMLMHDINCTSPFSVDSPRTPCRRKSNATQPHWLEKKAENSVSSRTRSNLRRIEGKRKLKEIFTMPLEHSKTCLSASISFQYPALSNELQRKKNALAELGRSEHLVLCALYRLHKRKVLPKNLARIKEEIRLFSGQYQGTRASINSSTTRRAYFRLLDMGIVTVSKNIPYNVASSELVADTLEELTTCKFQDYSLYGSFLKEFQIETQLEKWALQEVTFTT